MIEKIILFEQVDLAVFYGVNNCNIQLLKTLFPKLRLAARGSVMKVIGDEQDAEAFERIIRQLESYCVEFNVLNDDAIVSIVKGSQPVELRMDNLIIHGVGGKSICSRTLNQKRLVEEFEKNDMVFALGPAGSGKKLGFLPGDMKEKIDPYLQPLYDALQDMLPAVKLKEYMETNVIQIAPLAFMRGRTLSDAIIILDEAQNTTTQQIKMFLTRLGMGAKMIITGDITQIDLPPVQKSGMIQALQILRGVKGIGKVEFDKSDIVRHKLVQRIVEAYEKEDERRKAERAQKE